MTSKSLPSDFVSTKPITGSGRVLPVTRIFSRDKAIQSPWLNRLGVQVFRTLASRAIYRLRPERMSPLVRDEAAELRREGVVLLHDFLPADLFGLIREECLRAFDNHQAELTVFSEGPNILESVDVNRFAAELTHVLRVFEDPRLRALTEAAEKRRLIGPGFRGLERLTQGMDNGQEDSQTKLHSDIFYNVHKAWFYITDVSVDDAPLVYAKRSHRISLAQLGYLYRESCHENFGSRRISPNEFKRLGLRETVVTCPRNTLVVANTFGYHRRLRGQPGRQRVSLHLSLRSRPFAWR